MEPSFQDVAGQCGQPSKKIKQNQQQWIVVQKKNKQLSITISDYSKVNKYYSHRSIQAYLRYLLSQTVPNPMWLSIKRQSLIQQILYIDLQIQSSLFEWMLQKKQLSFLGEKVNQTNKALFKNTNRIMREELWQCLLCCQNQESSLLENRQNKVTSFNTAITQQLYNKYASHTLTSEEMRAHLYPCKELPLYSQFYQVKKKVIGNEWKNKILVVDCQMVVSEAGFQLARTTILNFEGEIIFDELFKPESQIINYNTQFSGITKAMLEKVQNTLENKLYPFLQSIVDDETIMVGHSLQNDLRAMKLIHSKVIDSSVLYMAKSGIKYKLKNLSHKILDVKIQGGEHDSKQDCLATLHIVRAKIQNGQNNKPRQYQILKELQQNHKKVAIIDYAIDHEMKAFRGNHYQKIQPASSPQNVLRVVSKYLKRDVCQPNLVLTRVEKRGEVEWQKYYQQFDESLQASWDGCPRQTAVLINCQVNPSVSIVLPGQSMKTSASIRNPCLILSK